MVTLLLKPKMCLSFLRAKISTLHAEHQNQRFTPHYEKVLGSKMEEGIKIFVTLMNNIHITK